MELDLFDRTGENDLLDVEEIKLKKGNSVTLRKHDPYGFWTIHWGRGQLPETLKGSYTSRSYARQAAVAYLRSKGMEGEILP